MILACLCLFRVMKGSTHRRWNRTSSCGRALTSWNRARRNSASDTSWSRRVILNNVHCQCCRVTHLMSTSKVVSSCRIHRQTVAVNVGDCGPASAVLFCDCILIVSVSSLCSVTLILVIKEWHETVAAVDTSWTVCQFNYNVQLPSMTDRAFCADCRW